MTTDNRIQAVVIEVGKLPKYVMIENTLEAFQKLVGGYIEVVRMDGGVNAVINEEGKLLELEPNIALRHGGTGQVVDYIAGTAVLVSVDDEGDFASIEDRQLEKLSLPLYGERK